MLHMLRFSSESWKERFEPGASHTRLMNLLADGVNVSSGRQAIHYLCRLLELQAGDTCLLPAYVAEGVLLPLKKLKLNYQFYPLDEHLNPDQQALEKLLQKHPDTKLIFLIHPFGKTASINREHIRQHYSDVCFVDDYALSLDSGLKRYSAFKQDFSLFSYNKFIPCLDGATLIVPKAYRKSYTFPDCQPQLLTLAEQHLFENAAAFESQDTAKALEKIAQSYELYYDELNKSYSPTNISPASRKLLSEIDVEKLSGIRQENTKRLYARLNRQKYSFYFKIAELGNCPFAVPMYPNHADRDSVVNAALKNNVLLSVLQEKWNFIPQGQEHQFANEYEFINNHILVPVSEILTEEQMNYIIDTLNGI